MAKRSKGSRSQTRKKLRKNPRQRGLTPITRSLQTFEAGDVVTIDIDPAIHKGQPHARFQGTTGKVAGTQGKAYVVRVRDGGMHKEVIARPEHLRPFEHGAAGAGEEGETAEAAEADATAGTGGD